MLLNGAVCYLADAQLAHSLSLQQALSSELASTIASALSSLSLFLSPTSRLTEAATLESFLSPSASDGPLSIPLARLSAMLLEGGLTYPELSCPSLRSTLLRRAFDKLPPLRQHGLEIELRWPSPYQLIHPAGASALLLGSYALGKQCGAGEALVPGLLALESALRAVRASSAVKSQRQTGRGSTNDAFLQPLQFNCENAARALRSICSAVRVGVPGLSDEGAARRAVEAAGKDAEGEAREEGTRYSVLRASERRVCLIANGMRYRSDGWQVVDSPCI